MFEELKSLVSKGFEALHGRLGGVESDVSTVKADLAEAKSIATEAKSAIDELKAQVDFSGLEALIKSMTSASPAKAAASKPTSMNDIVAAAVPTATAEEINEAIKAFDATPAGGDAKAAAHAAALSMGASESDAIAISEAIVEPTPAAS